ncbi:universal stress protein [Spongiactinospora sp. TRM90649]|uniref:universal stress protein n=1 Tax=Spongiactinospora sp. TRM90649 TaxID=3031114 RepID=UPI0023F62E83|nr:universal stress protein [Spongiactinospora sp. TRM90649]MDF5755194.1 universal stress protein [Spongiactinospora sp. TRM90649]
MTGHVTVGTDGSRQATIAVKWAVEDAVRRGVGLRIVHACEDWAYDLPYRPVPKAPTAMSTYCEGLLTVAADLARGQAPGLEVTTRLVAGPVVGVLAEESERAAQIVVGGRGAGGFVGMLLGSVGNGLAGHTVCPLVVVRGAQDSVQGQIVAGFDGTGHSEAALEYAYEEAERRGAGLRVVFAWQAAILAPYASGYARYLDDLFTMGERTIKEKLAPWIERHPRVPTIITAVCDHPVTAICAASKEADLVVVGTRQMGRFGSALLGSVSRGVLHHTNCPVAVVPHQRPS